MVLNKEVQAYYGDYDPSTEISKIRYDLVTAIIYHSVSPRGDGSLYKDSSYNPASLISYAHSQGTKVILSFIDYSQSDTDTMLSSSTSRTNCVNNLLNEVITKGFDGIDNDLESSSMTITSKNNMTLFQQQLYNTFKTSNPNYRISIAIGAYYPSTDQRFDVQALQNYTSYFMIMGYDWYGSWSSTAGPNSPHLLDYGQGNYDTIKHYESLLNNKKQLLFGVPYYGKEFMTQDNTRLSPLTSSYVNAIIYKDYINYINSYNPRTDSVWKTPWYARQSGGQWYQGHYDDVVSLGQKYDIVNSEGLGGIGIWEISQGSGRTELWDLIQNKFAACQTPSCAFQLY
jgi:GH18 family chitinase